MRVIIVDDDHLVTASLKTILQTDSEIEVAAVGNSGEEAIKLHAQYQPDIMLMDIRMGEKNGIQTAKEILAKDKIVKVLFLTTFTDNDYIIQALHIGAKGYLLKQDFENLIPALKAVSGGQSVFGSEVVSKIPDLLHKSEAFDYSRIGVNAKEAEIIKLVADAYSNKEIADKLFLSKGTVRNYISAILDKLDLRDRTQLAVFYHQHK